VTPTVDKVLAHYRANGGRTLPGASDDILSSFERDHEIQLPSEVAAFYRSINGAESFGDSLFELWPLMQVGSVPEVVAPWQNFGRLAQVLPGSTHYFVFADCMIWSQLLAVRLRPPTSSTEVVWLCGSAYAKVAASFSDFWEKFISHPADVLWAHGAIVVDEVD